MFRDDFDKLPIGMRVTLIANKLFARDEFAMDEVPKVPFPPKWDDKIRRKDGYQWASETDLASLRYWHSKAEEGSHSGEYAEKNAKQAKALSYWVAWREAFPSEFWTGGRDRRQVTAAAPSGKPRIHPWEPRREEPARDAHEPETDPADDDQLPF